EARRRGAPDGARRVPLFPLRRRLPFAEAALPRVVFVSGRVKRVVFSGNRAYARSGLRLPVEARGLDGVDRSAALRRRSSKEGRMSRSSPISLPQEFYEARLITGIDHVVKSGKEATVYCCRAHPATGAEFLAAKVYRPRQVRSFQNDAVYQQGRVIQAVDDRDGLKMGAGRW